jgi:hypothetical protein
MKRRNFLKLMGVAPIAPKALEAIPKKEQPKELPVENIIPETKYMRVEADMTTCFCELSEGIFDDEDIPDKYKWKHVYWTVNYRA